MDWNLIASFMQIMITQSNDNTPDVTKVFNFAQMLLSSVDVFSFHIIFLNSEENLN